MYKKSKDKMNKVRETIKMLLHAGYDGKRNRKEPIGRLHCNDPYYSEAFGMLRTLEIFDLGKFGAVNVPGTLNHWFAEIQDEVEKEEGFGGNNQCDICFEKYGKDFVRTRRR